MTGRYISQAVARRDSWLQDGAVCSVSAGCAPLVTGNVSPACLPRVTLVSRVTCPGGAGGPPPAVRRGRGRQVLVDGRRHRSLQRQQDWRQQQQQQLPAAEQPE